MNEAVGAFFLVFAGLFPVVNPLGLAPIFLSLTDDCTPEERERLARAVAFNGLWLLLGSLLFGSLILEFFGITVPVVRVAGGLLVSVVGWKLLTEDPRSAEHKAIRADGVSSQSFYPLTMPLTIGPGSISVAITFGSYRPEADDTVAEIALLVSAAVAGLLAIMATVYICYRFAGPLARLLGQSGVNVLVRLSAFILVCIGIQICWSGVSALIATLGD